MDIPFQQLFEAMPCYVTVQGRDLRIQAANHLFCKEFGPGVGTYCYERYKGRSEKCEECPVERSFSDGEVHHGQQLVRRLDGREVWVYVYTAPLRNASGTIEAAIEVSADITEVKRLQQRFHTLFEESPCYISVQNRDLIITQANRRFRSDFGDGTGHACYEVYKHSNEPCLSCPVARTFQDGQTYCSEEVVSTREGRRENVICTSAALRGPDGSIEEVMEMSANITELRQLQDRLTSLGLLVGSVSHGIKGLLNGLDGGIYLMETGFSKSKPERVKQGWDILKRNVERIRSMVLNVLYYAKDREVAWSTLDIAEVCAAAAGVVQNRATQLGVTLEAEGSPGAFEADGHAVSAMLVNLLENGLDACRLEKRKPHYRVRIEGHAEPDQAVFTVSDNGLGMDQETREKVFSLFFSSKGAEGTGLGLFIAHKIVSSHGGSIDLESEPGLGTRFVVRLPRRRPVHPGGPGALSISENAARGPLEREWDEALGP